MTSESIILGDLGPKPPRVEIIGTHAYDFKAMPLPVAKA